MEQNFITVRKDFVLDNELKQWKKGSPTGVVNRLLETAAMLKVENVVAHFAVSVTERISLYFGLP
jgi:hypothetical protein